MPATLDSISAQLSELLEVLKAAQTVAPRPAYENPEITDPQTVTADGKTFNADGSIWDHDWRTGGPQPVAYGYFSQAKDPATYAALEAKFGATFTEWFAAQDKWTVYAGNPRTYVEAGDLNWITLTQFVLKRRTRHVQ